VKTNKAKFSYFITNSGANDLLKEEIKALYPTLKFSFSTDNFLTFKVDGFMPNLIDIVFCRHFGEFIAKGPKSEMELKWKSFNGPKTSFDLEENIFYKDEFKAGDTVYELIKLNDDLYYIGKVILFSQKDYLKYLALFYRVPEMNDAPSRAYMKILEGENRVGVNFKKGERALEIGSSPGGATYALLSKGLIVEGVDPGGMDPKCFEFKTFNHHQTSIQNLNIESINPNFEWLLVDMNLAPEATLAEIEKIFKLIGPDFKGAFLTLKMTKLSKIGQIPFYVKLIKRMGLHPKILTQLKSHHQEFLMYVEKTKF
jgi:23S rRNA (cytidine2498-2'-O)-methyltransferase